MEELGIDVHPSELHALFLKYDSNKDEKLTLTEFARIFIPRSSIYAKKMEYKGQIALQTSENRQERNDVSGFMDETHEEFVRCIRGILHNLNSIENLKKELKEEGFDHRFAFTQLDKYGFGNISRYQVSKQYLN